MAKQDVVEVQAMPFCATLLSITVVVHADDSTWLMVVATCTLPLPSTIAQNDDERQDTPFMLAVPWSFNVHAVDAGFVEYRKNPWPSCPATQKDEDGHEIESTPYAGLYARLQAPPSDVAS
jgi:hypothetical protein